MNYSVIRLCAGIFLLTILAACGISPAASTRASILEVGVPGPGISELSRQFQRETPSIVNFAFDKYNLDAEAQRRLDIQAEWILDHPMVRFRVYGHTDKVGNTAYNMALGMRRANAAVQYLTGKGISPLRLETMVSFGEEFPVIDTEDRELANRRTLTDVIGFVVPSASAGLDESVDEVEIAAVEAPSELADEPVGEVADEEPTEEQSRGGGSSTNSGRGNGDESGDPSDPGNSDGRNNGGDEVL